MVVSILNTQNVPVDVAELTDKLASVGISTGILSDFRFCPYIICYKNPADGTTVVDTVNEGYLPAVKRNSTVMDAESMTDFITAAISIKKGNIVQNALF